MSEHLQAVMDYVAGNDESELAKVKAELAYALMSLEREIAIAQNAQAQNADLVKALESLLAANKTLASLSPHHHNRNAAIAGQEVAEREARDVLGRVKGPSK